MKSIWTALSVLAIANLLALGGVFGWLYKTGRLDARRVQETRQVFSETIAARQAREAEDVAKAEQAKKDAEEKGKFEKAPLTASQLLEHRIDLTELDRQRAERLRRDVDDLKAGLARQQQVLDKERAELFAERTAFEDMRKKIAQTEGSAQFKKALGALEAMKPEQSYSTIKTIIQEDAKEGMNKVVAYVNAMQDRPRSKLMTKIVEGDPKLAAELLERIRSRGTTPVPAVGGGAMAAAPPTPAQ
jgi:predicted negative regulator of RcsB-dependent stress response